MPVFKNGGVFAPEDARTCPFLGFWTSIFSWNFSVFSRWMPVFKNGGVSLKTGVLRNGAHIGEIQPCRCARNSQNGLIK
jgi:hypothetical protein